MVIPLNRWTLPLVLACRLIVMATRLRGIDRLLRLLFEPTKLSRREFEVWLGDLRYRGRTANFIDWCVLFYGAYEEDDLLVLHAFAEADGVEMFLDIGANVGQHALFVSSVCERVLAFEPTTALQDQFLLNIDLNNAENIEIIPFALGQKDSVRRLYLGDDNGKSSLLAGANGNMNDTSIQVEVRQGDGFLHERSANNGIGLMKIDVEGFEYSVLRGLSEVLRKNRPVIVLEISSAGQEHFGDLEHFVQSFPPEYTFFAWRSVGWLLRDRVLRIVDADEALGEYGNVYAVPGEKVQLFEEVLKNLPKRIRHRNAWRVRLV